MRTRILIIMGVALFAVSTTVTIAPRRAHAFNNGAVASFDVRYKAASVHVAVDGTAETAVGLLDCNDALDDLVWLVRDGFGGACFPLRQYKGGRFVVTIDDRVMPTLVGMIAGFDDDGDSCVGCIPGADKAYQGEGIIGGNVTGDILFVFVRIASLEDDYSTPVGTFGTMHVDVFAQGVGHNPCDNREPYFEPCGDPLVSAVPNFNFVLR